MAKQEYDNIRVSNKNDIRENWDNSRIIPLDGELLIYNPDKSNKHIRIKFGDGEHYPKDLPFFLGVEDGEKLVYGVGEPYPNGGEIFNDYENNIALSSYSTAKGYKTVAGCLGFTILGSDSIDVITLSNTNGIEAGAKLSLYIAPREGNSSHPFGNYDLYTTVKSVSGNTIVLSKSLPDGYEFTPNCGDYMWFPYIPNLEGDIVLGTGASAEGYETKAATVASHTEGYNTIALGKYAHAEGNSTTAGYAAHAEGIDTQALGKHSHAEGDGCTAQGQTSHAEGYQTKSISFNSHTEGTKTNSTGEAAHAEGVESITNGTAAHAEGYKTYSLNYGSHSEGVGTKTYSKGSHVEGCDNFIGVFNNHILDETFNYDGAQSTFIGVHAEGVNTKAGATNRYAQGAHAEGNTTKAYGPGTHSEGVSTIAQSDTYDNDGTTTRIGGAHSEGYYTQAKAVGAHAEGGHTIASHRFSHTGGYYTKTSAANQTVIGKFNSDDSSALFIVGNGTGDTSKNRGNAFTVRSNGTATIKNTGTNSDNVVNYGQLQTYVDTRIGDIEAVLNEIITTQNELIGGET